MRYSRFEQQNYDNNTKNSSNGFKAGAFLIIIVFVIVVSIYFIGASKIGNFISNKIITPVFNFFAKNDVANSYEETSINTDILTNDVLFNQYSAYILQIGVFDNESSARTLASDMKINGCADIVYNFDGSFRVFIVGYNNKEDADFVQNRVMSEYELNCEIFEMKVSDKMFEVEADESILLNIEKTTKDVIDIPEKVIEVSQNYDRNAIDKTEVYDQIQNIHSHSIEMKNIYAEYSNNSENDLLYSIRDYYDDISNITEFSDDLTDIELSSALKSLYIDTIIVYDKLVAGIT